MKHKKKLKLPDSGTYIGNGKTKKIKCNPFWNVLIIKKVK